jgi:D-amino-acid dehydrogenase
MKVAVVGGGAIGLAIAQRLVHSGAEVLVVERDAVGQATSLGNAGWITPMLSTPLAGPGVLRKSARWLIDPSSPLYVRPRLDPWFALWCLRFARNCTRGRSGAASRALLGLNASTLAAFDRLREDGISFEMHSRGLIVACTSEKNLAAEWATLEELRVLGYEGSLELLDGDGVRSLEPVLSKEVVGGIYAGTERHVRPETLTAGLAEWLRNAGAEIREHTEVTRIVKSGSGWVTETTAGDDFAADRVVIAAGVWTKRLLQQLGTRIPLEGAKGYSVTVGANGELVQHAIMLQEAKVGVTPFVGGYRLAGTLELAGESLTLNRRRLRAIVEAAARYLNYDTGTAGVEWAGLRPTLPDSLPVIGRVPSVDGVFVATGHGMLGITLAPSTAEALTPLVLEDELRPELEPFRADRSY